MSPSSLVKLVVLLMCCPAAGLSGAAIAGIAAGIPCALLVLLIVLAFIYCGRRGVWRFLQLSKAQLLEHGACNANVMVQFQGIVHPKMKILSSFTHPKVVPNKRYFVEWWLLTFILWKSKATSNCLIINILQNIFLHLHLANAFIQSNLQCIQAIHFFVFQYVCSLGIEPTIFLHC